MTITKSKGIFLREANNGRKFEVKLPLLMFQNSVAGATVYIVLYTNSVQPCIPLDVT